jgi:5-formyltetrahydrofolate cyclo-ligase
LSEDSQKKLRQRLRRELRARRCQLSPAEQNQAAHALHRQVCRHPVFLKSQRVAFYMAEDGEIDPLLLLQTAEKMGKQCYLPILHPLKKKCLLFGRYRSGDQLFENYFGLREPPPFRNGIKPWALDLVLMPLVGFDRQGNRLGMGGGFYDRTFSFKQKTSPFQHLSASPILMGVAHQCQEIESLQQQDWDIPMDWVATDREIISAS